jgi:hypothetical protein
MQSDSPDMLAALLDIAYNTAQHVLLDEHKHQLHPAFVLLNADATVGVVETAWRNGAQKEAALAAMREIMADHRTIAYSFLTEAWMAEYGPDPANHPLQGGPRPADMPNRVEVVQALATDGVETRWRQWEIKRDAGRRITALVEKRYPDDVVLMDSPFAELLPKVDRTVH